MFDPDSGHPPATVEEGGGYSLDLNLRYFGAIFDWLRHRKLMVSLGIEMDDVGQVADYLGLEELCQVIKEKKREKKKMLDSYGPGPVTEASSLMFSSTRVVAESVGDCLSIFL